MKPEIKYFNSEEAALVLGVNVSTIKRWTDEEKLECIRSAGGHRKFLMGHLTAFLEQNKKRTSRINLFPLETETDLRINNHIIKGDFPFLIDYLERIALKCQRERVQHILNGLYLAQYSLYVIYDNLITPVLRRIGLLWEQGMISIIEEHFASQTIRDSLIRLQGIIRIQSRKKGKVLLINFNSELHDIALKMVDHILEYRGFDVYYSGQLSKLLKSDQIFQSLKPNRVYLSSTIVENVKLVQEELDYICELCARFGAEFYVGGQGFDRLSIQHPAITKRMFTFEEAYKI